MIKKYDFVISGGGLVGCVVASELSRINFRCCIVEKNKFSISNSKKNISPLSLNYRSKIILDKFQLWKSLIKNCNPINELSIKHFDNLNSIHFHSKEISLPHLGYIFDRQIMQNTLREEILTKKNITVFDNAKITNIDCDKLHNQITLSRENTTISSKYVIVCDSPQSELVKFVSSTVEKVDYNQTSLVAGTNGIFSESHALQFFCKYGVLALIPHNQNQASLVLTVKNPYLNKFIVDDYINSPLVSRLFGDFCKNLVLDNKFDKYEMKTSRAKSLVKDNVILLGNSSHLIHTIGAQGFNLALRNVETLVDHFRTINKNKKNSLHDILNTLEGDRKEVFDNIDFALNIFINSGPLSRLLSKSLILSMKLNSNVKNDFLREITGLNNYPYLSVEQL